MQIAYPTWIQANGPFRLQQLPWQEAPTGCSGPRKAYTECECVFEVVSGCWDSTEA